jgi:hypothetical protein
VHLLVASWQAASISKGCSKVAAGTANSEEMRVTRLMARAPGS